MNVEVFKQSINDHTLICATVGLGYVGLPLAVEKARAGFRTIGFDVQAERVDMVNAGKNYIGDVVQEDLERLVAEGTLEATTDSRGSPSATSWRSACPRPSTLTSSPTPPTWRRRRAR